MISAEAALLFILPMASITLEAEDTQLTKAVLTVSSNHQLQRPAPAPTEKSQSQSGKPLEERVGRLESKIDELVRRRQTRAKSRTEQTLQPILPSADSLSPSQSKLDKPLSSQNKSVEERVSGLENQISELTKKVEVRQKDFWDKLNSISGLLSGAIIAGIGILLSSLLKRAELKALKDKNERELEDNKKKFDLEKLKTETENKDRTAKLELENLANQRAQTQLRIDEASKEREIAISQAQTVQGLLPSLLSRDERVRASALKLIACLGNPKLVTDLSGLFGDKDIESEASVLQVIASMSDAKIDIRRRAAFALTRFGQTQEAADRLVELSGYPEITIKDKQHIAEDLEKIKEHESAAMIRLDIACHPSTEVDLRIDAIDAIKRLNYTEKARQRVVDRINNDELNAKNRITAIKVLMQLDNTIMRTDEFAPVLCNMIKKPEIEYADFVDVVNILVQLRQDTAAKEFWEVANDPKIDLLKRFFAIEILHQQQSGNDGEVAKKRIDILHEIMLNPHTKGDMLRIVIGKLEQSVSKEDLAARFRKIVNSPQEARQLRVRALWILKRLGYAEEAKEKMRKLSRQSNAQSTLRT